MLIIWLQFQDFKLPPMLSEKMFSFVMVKQDTKYITKISTGRWTTFEVTNDDVMKWKHFPRY